MAEGVHKKQKMGDEAPEAAGECPPLPRELWTKVSCCMPIPERCNLCQVSKTMRDAADESVTALTVSFARSHSQFKDIIELVAMRFRWVRELRLHIDMGSQRDLQPLAGLKQLQNLCLTMNEGKSVRLLDYTLHTISRMRSLRCLCLVNMVFQTPAGVQTLSSLPNLLELQLSNCRPHSMPVMDAIASLTGLTSLEILRPYCFQDQGYSAIGALTKLHKLSLGCSWMLGLEKEPLHFCSNLQHLRELSLRKCFASDESLEPLTSLTSLKRLSLHHLHRLHGHGLGYITKNAHLTCLSLHGCGILKDDCLDHIAGLQSLRSLNLGSSTLITEAAALGTISQLTQLTQLVTPQQITVPQQAGLQWEHSNGREVRNRRQIGQMEENLREMFVENQVQYLLDDPVVEGTHGRTAAVVLRWFAEQGDR